MALSEFESKRCERVVAQYVERKRPPVSLRSEVDLSFRVLGQSVEIFEVRPHWQDRSKRIEVPVAKATFNRTGAGWKVFWRMSDLKWHTYQPAPQVKTIEEFLALVEQDTHACFHG